MSVAYHEGFFPPVELDWNRLIGPIASASDAIGRYDSYLGIIPNPQLLLSPLLMNEAVTSSRIEGTHTTVQEVLAYEAGQVDVTDLQKSDIQEVINYRLALFNALRMMKSLPLSGRILRESHGILLDGVRGQSKSPGRYRVEQNWIGSSYRIEEARYVPISPEKLEDAMAEWEKYVNESDHASLIKIAVAHAEFEAIHPFNDGNGRIGRIIIPLMLCSEGAMTSPCFYMSEFFEHRNTEYQDRLLAVSSENDWTGWCVFFLNALEAQAKENLAKAKAIHALYETTRSELIEASNTPAADKAIDVLFRAPVFPANAFANIEGVNSKTGRRSAILVFPELLAITENIQVLD